MFSLRSLILGLRHRICSYGDAENGAGGWNYPYPKIMVTRFSGETIW